MASGARPIVMGHPLAITLGAVTYRTELIAGLARCRCGIDATRQTVTCQTSWTLNQTGVCATVALVVIVPDA